MEAAGCSYAEEAARKFNSLSDELTKLLHGRREGDKEYINALFDELNALNYKLPIVTNPEKALLLLHQCCSLVPPDDTFLAAKASQLTTRLVAQAARRGVRPEGATLARVLRWTTDALRSTALLATPDVLAALEALLRANAARLERPLELTGLLAPLLAPERSRPEAAAAAGPGAAQAPALRCLTPPPGADARRDLRARALRCLEALLAPSPDCPSAGAAGGRAPRPGDELPPPEVLAACERAFQDALRAPPNYRDPDDAYSVQRSQTLAVALRGLRSAVARTPTAPNDERLGQMLALATAYLAHGLLPPGSYPPPPPPARIYPSSLPPGSVPRAPPPGPDRPQPAKTVRMRNRFKKADPGRHGGDEAEGDDSGGGAGGGALWGWSDSETSSGGSDSEGGGGTGGGRAAAAARVRLAAVLLVLSLTWRADRRALLAYWPWLLAIEPLQVNYGTLARAATRDPSARVRAEAAAALSAALMGARPFLRLAENRDRDRGDGDAPFTAFSTALGGALRDLHRELGGTLFREEVPATATQLLRCLAQLAQHAPYRRLVPGLPATAARHARPFTQHRDAAVQVASFTALRSVAAADAPESELLAALRYLPRPAAGPDALPDTWRPAAFADQNQNGEDDEEEWEEEVAPDEEGESDVPANHPVSDVPAGQSQAEAEVEAAREALARGLREGEARTRPCWLVAACLRRLAPGADATPVLRIECLQTLRAVAARFFAPLLQPHLHSALLPALLRCLASTDDPALAQGDGASVNSGGSGALRLHAARVLEALALALAKEEGERALTDARAFWGRLLAVRRPIQPQPQPQPQAQAQPPALAPLPQLLAAGDPAERATALDLLAAMHDAAYAALPRREQVLALTLAPGALADADAAVRAAAARALGLSAAFREPRASPDFLWTLAERLGDALLHDASATARARAAWALAEVSDALVEDAPTHGSPPDCADLLRLLQAAHRGAVDVDKVRSHAVRAAGNALRLLPAHALEEDGAGAGPEAERALEALARAADAGAFMKARWNACYALANAAHNPALFGPRPRWQDAACTTVLRLVQRCSNFKVRKAAAAALAAAATGMTAAEAELGAGTARQRFGTQLVPAWNALLSAMERACAPTDPEEAAHRDGLLEQLALAAAAVAVVAASGAPAGELETLREVADARAEVARAAAEAALRARPPERATPLLTAAEALRARARDPGPARAHAIALRALFLPGGDALNIVLSSHPEA